jgi:hypothetical protein
VPGFYNQLPVIHVLPAYTRTCSDEVFKMALVIITLDMWGKGVRKQTVLNHTLKLPVCTTCPKGISTEGGMLMRLEMEDILLGISLL